MASPLVKTTRAKTAGATVGAEPSVVRAAGTGSGGSAPDPAAAGVKTTGPKSPDAKISGAKIPGAKIPGAKPTSKDEILDAAERLFASRGFDGTSMREIAQAAGVAQALLHYHFRSKEGLFEAMFTRRADAINAIRLKRLDAMVAAGGFTLEDLLDSLLRPTVEAGHDPARGGRSFAHLVLSAGTIHEDWGKALIARSYDAMARRYIAVLQDLLPGLTVADATWGYLFVVGAALTQMSPTGRADRLSDGATTDQDLDALIARAIVFSAAGLRVLAPKPSLPPPEEVPAAT